MVFNFNPTTYEYVSNDLFKFKTDTVYSSIGDFLKEEFPDNFKDILRSGTSISGGKLYNLTEYSLGISNYGGGIKPLGFISEITSKSDNSTVGYLEKFNFDEDKKVNGEFAHNYISFNLSPNYTR